MNEGLGHAVPRDGTSKPVSGAMDWHNPASPHTIAHERDDARSIKIESGH